MYSNYFHTLEIKLITLSVEIDALRQPQNLFFMRIPSQSGGGGGGWNFFVGGLGFFLGVGADPQ